MTQSVLVERDVKIRKTIFTVKDRKDFANEVNANFKRGDKIWLSGLISIKNSSPHIVQAEFYSIHEKGHFISVYIEGNQFLESVLCVGSIFIEMDLGDGKYNKKIKEYSRSLIPEEYKNRRLPTLTN